ncbi:MAG: D,D-heptose 1,7-bisphosphate phosphatase, partial [Deltaproteobacteria bacterium]|nr:D,D-heptose 1,7-bisphosphate phosphatase [Deltaproteobacteria bacterium]
MNIRRAVFLDRDGTISEEVGYLRRLEDLVLIERAGSGIRL